MPLRNVAKNKRKDHFIPKHRIFYEDIEFIQSILKETISSFGLIWK